mgnify:CR=1 FL=1
MVRVLQLEFDVVGKNVGRSNVRSSDSSIIERGFQGNANVIMRQESDGFAKAKGETGTTDSALQDLYETAVHLIERTSPGKVGEVAHIGGVMRGRIGDTRNDRGESAEKRMIRLVLGTLMEQSR